jgi:hypothetical protein
MEFSKNNVKQQNPKVTTDKNSSPTPIHIEPWKVIRNGKVVPLCNMYSCQFCNDEWHLITPKSTQPTKPYHPRIKPPNKFCYLECEQCWYKIETIERNYRLNLTNALKNMAKSQISDQELDQTDNSKIL